MNNLVVGGMLDISNLVVAGSVQTYVSMETTVDSMTISSNAISNSILTGGLQIPNGGISVKNGSYFGGNVQIIESTTLNGNLIDSSNVQISGTVNNIQGIINIDTLPPNIMSINGITKGGIFTNRDPSANTWMGQGVMETYISNNSSTDHNNTVMGYGTLGSMDNGSNNVAMGWNTMPITGSGSRNTGVGSNVLTTSTVSVSNTAVGFNSMTLINSIDASCNVSLGCNSLYRSSTCSQTTIVGADACPLSTGFEWGTMTTIGYYSGFENFQGRYGTFVGAFADVPFYDTGDSPYQYSSAVGFNAKVNERGNHQIILGTATETVQILGSAKVSGNVDISGNLTVGPGPTGRIFGTVIPYSDARLKEQASPLPSVLPAFLQLQPKRFRWKESQKEDVGFIAQEFYEVMGPDLWPTDSIHTAPNGFMTLDYSKMVVFLTKVVQELEQEYEKLQEAAALL